MTKIVCEPPPGADYPKITFDTDEAKENVTITIGEKIIALTFTELSALHSGLTHLVNYDYNPEPAGPRGGEPEQVVRPE